MYIINATSLKANMYTTAIKPLRTIRESAIKEQIVRCTTVTPKDYCDKWITKKTGLQPDEWGYASACVRELSKVLGCSEIAVRKWGKDFQKCPEHIGLSLANVDKLNSIAEILEK